MIADRPRLMSSPSPSLCLRAAAIGAAALAIAVPAACASPVPGEVVVDFRGDASSEPKVIETADVDGTIAQLRARPDVRYAVRNVRARATQTPATFTPNDPGRTGRAGGWRSTQWYLSGAYSINAPAGWANLIAAGKPGAAGVTVAILDSGVAYKAVPPRPASPELPRSRFLAGVDLVDGDQTPADEYGHGTIVAAILAGETDNGRGLAGIAYRTRLLPVRVLDTEGLGDATTIAKGIRYAVKRGAQVINLSLEFPAEYSSRDIPQVIDALKYARKRGVTIVVASGNEGLTSIPYPGRSSTVIAVGATTERGCAADYSNGGAGLDLVAPGGGDDGEWPDATCSPATPGGRGITQLTLVGASKSTLALSSRDGTSMAAPQVSAAAAAVIASGVIGPNPTPAQVQRRLEKTARDLGPAGYDERYGNGLVDIGAATSATP